MAAPSPADKSEASKRALAKAAKDGFDKLNAEERAAYFEGMDQRMWLFAHAGRPDQMHDYYMHRALNGGRQNISDDEARLYDQAVQNKAEIDSRDGLIKNTARSDAQQLRSDILQMKQAVNSGFNRQGAGLLTAMAVAAAHLKIQLIDVPQYNRLHGHDERFAAPGITSPLAKRDAARWKALNTKKAGDPEVHERALDALKEYAKNKGKGRGASGDGPNRPDDGVENILRPGPGPVPV